MVVKHDNFNGRSHWVLFVVGFFLFWSGCVFNHAAHEQTIGDVGRMVWQRLGVDGFVIGVPHGTAESGAIEYAKAISDASGAGLLVAHGFSAKRVAVTQPLIHTSPIFWGTRDARRQGSVYPQFKEFLQSTIAGPLTFYVGVRLITETSRTPHIEIASAGLSFEQLVALKKAYAVIRDESLRDLEVPKLEIALDPLDYISSRAFGVKNHGVLMLADKGLILRLPAALTTTPFKSAYQEIITKWVMNAAEIARRDSPQWPDIQIRRLTHGRIDLTSSRKHFRGTVIAAPHGSFDWYTAELVEELSYRTSFAAVVTRGFTPTECDGWRINVNRPTERRYPTGAFERETERAKEVYQHFGQSVSEAARGRLDLYLEMHQNSSVPNIDVATVGITPEKAKVIKTAYQKIRDRMLREQPDLPRVSFSIEPLDQIAIGAWAAKDRGILRLAKSSLHFELPAEHLFYRENARRAYTTILAELINSITSSPPVLN
jgi:hypothetical protein